MAVPKLSPNKKKAIIIVTAVIILLAVSGTILGIVLSKKDKTFSPSGLSVKINEQNKFLVEIDWEDVKDTKAYIIEYQYSLYPGEIHNTSSTQSKVNLMRKREEIKFRIQCVTNDGKENPFSKWYSILVEPLELPFWIEPTLDLDAEEEHKYILTLPFISYDRYDGELGLVTTFEIKEKLPSDTEFRQSIFRSREHVYILPEDEKGTFTVKVRALNNTTFTAKDAITGQRTVVTENEPVELYDLYESSDWIEVSIEIV